MDKQTTKHETSERTETTVEKQPDERKDRSDAAEPKGDNTADAKGDKRGGTGE